MVSTRGHPNGIEPEPILTKSPKRAYNHKSIMSSSSSPSPTSAPAQWAHTPSNLILGWLFISLPLVIWDTGYVMARPHTMAGGKWQWPLYMPYDLYAKIDYIYGWPAYDGNNGFTSAQTLLNIFETSMYVYYLFVLFTKGKPSNAEGVGAPEKKVAGILGEQRYVQGREGMLALLVAYSAAVMTVSKTVLYWANEYYSGFANIGHNSVMDLIFLWIIPNGAWIVLPSYIVYVFGGEILGGLAVATGTSSEDKSLLKSK
ncbi:hypothetical protein BJ878DRAFT_550091 [Calycina marina]|uniref:C6 transcription factor n=1 Tax=Calycina marina TaxID=1763456 RepID=A0A9P7ZBA6_9HELO|nr:hypothetical protein BJ878DRAFT_550091 [Calycina marina]